MSKRAAWPILLLTAVLLTGTVQGQSAEAEVAELRQQLSEMSARLDNLESDSRLTTILIANSYLAAGEFHAIDEALNSDEASTSDDPSTPGEYDPRYLTTVRDTITVIGGLRWPGSLHEPVEAFLTDAQALADALADEDMTAAAEAAEAAHGSQHQLSHAILGFVSDGAHGLIDAGPQIPEGAVTVAFELGERGGAVGGPDTFTARRGDVIALDITSAAAGDLHMHGYDLQWHLGAGDQMVATFPAESVGRFPIEFHPVDDPRGVVVAYIEVRP